MKKILFSDRYGLTQAVIERRKTMTRRIVPWDLTEQWMEFVSDAPSVGGVYVHESEKDFYEREAPSYEVGEVVAVAQNYANAFSSIRDIPVYGADRTPGWRNKMFVRADLMPHQIRITGIKCERLQDISDADCLKEGIFVNEYFGNGKKCHHYGFDGFFNGTEGWFARGWFDTPREAFAELIDKVCRKGTWASNPWTMVYEFELVK